MKVICISGKAGHGKDTAAALMEEELEAEGYRVLIAHYADLVKYICSTFVDWNGVKDEAGRHILQYVGTDAVRARNPDFWVNFIADILSFFPDEWDWVLIPDARFPNEIEVLKERGFDVTHVRIVRTDFLSSLTEEQQSHLSETALDDAVPDERVENSGSLDELRVKISKFVTALLHNETQIIQEELQHVN